MKKLFLLAITLVVALSLLTVFSYALDAEVSNQDPTVTAPPLPGDVNGDGVVDLADLMYVKYYTVFDEAPAGATNIYAADADGDGVISYEDYTELQKHTVGIESSYGPGRTEPNSGVGTVPMPNPEPTKSYPVQFVNSLTGVIFHEIYVRDGQFYSIEEIIEVFGIEAPYMDGYAYAGYEVKGELGEEPCIVTFLYEKAGTNPDKEFSVRFVNGASGEAFFSVFVKYGEFETVEQLMETYGIQPPAMDGYEYTHYGFEGVLGMTDCTVIFYYDKVGSSEIEGGESLGQLIIGNFVIDGDKANAEFVYMQVIFTYGRDAMGNLYFDETPLWLDPNGEGFSITPVDGYVQLNVSNVKKFVGRAFTMMMGGSLCKVEVYEDRIVCSEYPEEHGYFSGTVTANEDGTWTFDVPNYATLLVKACENGEYSFERIGPPSGGGDQEADYPVDIIDGYTGEVLVSFEVPHGFSADIEELMKKHGVVIPSHEGMMYNGFECYGVLGYGPVQIVLTYVEQGGGEQPDSGMPVDQYIIADLGFGDGTTDMVIVTPYYSVISFSATFDDKDYMYVMGKQLYTDFTNIYLGYSEKCEPVTRMMYKEMMDGTERTLIGFGADGEVFCRVGTYFEIIVRFSADSGASEVGTAKQLADGSYEIVLGGVVMYASAQEDGTYKLTVDMNQPGPGPQPTEEVTVTVVSGVDGKVFGEFTFKRGEYVSPAEFLKAHPVYLPIYYGYTFSHFECNGDFGYENVILTAIYQKDDGPTSVTVTYVIQFSGEILAHFELHDGVAYYDPMMVLENFGYGVPEYTGYRFDHMVVQGGTIGLDNVTVFLVYVEEGGQVDPDEEYVPFYKVELNFLDDVKLEMTLVAEGMMGKYVYDEEGSLLLDGDYMYVNPSDMSMLPAYAVEEIPEGYLVLTEKLVQRFMGKDFSMVNEEESFVLTLCEDCFKVCFYSPELVMTAPATYKYVDGRLFVTNEYGETLEGHLQADGTYEFYESEEQGGGEQPPEETETLLVMADVFFNEDGTCKVVLRAEGMRCEYDTDDEGYVVVMGSRIYVNLVTGEMIVEEEWSDDIPEGFSLLTKKMYETAIGRELVMPLTDTEYYTIMLHDGYVDVFYYFTDEDEVYEGEYWRTEDGQLMVLVDGIELFAVHMEDDRYLLWAEIPTGGGGGGSEEQREYFVQIIDGHTGNVLLETWILEGSVVDPEHLLSIYNIQIPQHENAYYMGIDCKGKLGYEDCTIVLMYEGSPAPDTGIVGGQLLEELVYGQLNLNYYENGNAQVIFGTYFFRYELAYSTETNQCYFAGQPLWINPDSMTFSLVEMDGYVPMDLNHFKKYHSAELTMEMDGAHFVLIPLDGFFSLTRYDYDRTYEAIVSYNADGNMVVTLLGEDRELSYVVMPTEWQGYTHMFNPKAAEENKMVHVTYVSSVNGMILGNISFKAGQYEDPYKAFMEQMGYMVGHTGYQYSHMEFDGDKFGYESGTVTVVYTYNGSSEGIYTVTVVTDRDGMREVFHVDRIKEGQFVSPSEYLNSYGIVPPTYVGYELAGIHVEGDFGYSDATIVFTYKSIGYVEPTDPIMGGEIIEEKWVGNVQINGSSATVELLGQVFAAYYGYKTDSNVLYVDGSEIWVNPNTNEFHPNKQANDEYVLLTAEVVKKLAGTAFVYQGGSEMYRLLVEESFFVMTVVSAEGYVQECNVFYTADGQLVLESGDYLLATPTEEGMYELVDVTERFEGDQEVGVIAGFFPEGDKGLTTIVAAGEGFALDYLFDAQGAVWAAESTFYVNADGQLVVTEVSEDIPEGFVLLTRDNLDAFMGKMLVMDMGGGEGFALFFRESDVVIIMLYAEAERPSMDVEYYKNENGEYEIVLNGNGMTLGALADGFYVVYLPESDNDQGGGSEDVQIMVREFVWAEIARDENGGYLLNITAQGIETGYMFDGEGNLLVAGSKIYVNVANEMLVEMVLAQMGATGIPEGFAPITKENFSNYMGFRLVMSSQYTGTTYSLLLEENRVLLFFHAGEQGVPVEVLLDDAGNPYAVIYEGVELYVENLGDGSYYLFENEEQNVPGQGGGSDTPVETPDVTGGEATATLIYKEGMVEVTVQSIKMRGAVEFGEDGTVYIDGTIIYFNPETLEMSPMQQVDGFILLTAGYYKKLIGEALWMDNGYVNATYVCWESYVDCAAEYNGFPTLECPDNGDGILDLSEVFGFRFQVVEYLGEDLYRLSIIA